MSDVKNSDAPEFGRCRTTFMLFSGVLALVSFDILPVGEKIPYLEISIPSKELNLTILAALLLYFGLRLILEWSKLDDSIKKVPENRFDFQFSLLIGFISFCVVAYIATLALFKTPAILFASLALVFIGIWLGAIPPIFADAYRCRRTHEEALRLGLPTTPVFFRTCFVGIRIVFVGLVIVAFLIWLLVPSIHSLMFGTILIPFLLVAVSGLWGKSSGTVAYKTAFDAHDVAYQLGGWDKKVLNRHSKFFLSCENGDYDLARLLLEEGHDPNIREYHGWTAIMIVAAENQVKLVSLLLEYGTDVNAINFHGRSALMYASRYGYNEMIKLLIEAGADINKIPNHGAGPLASAIAWEHQDTAKLLIEKGVVLNNIDSRNGNALDLARKLRLPNIIKLLVRKTKAHS